MLLVITANEKKKKSIEKSVKEKKKNKEYKEGLKRIISSGFFRLQD